MKQEPPFIYLFRTWNGHYFYDVNTNQIVEISKQAYEMLETMQKRESALTLEDINCDEIAILQENGFLKSTKVQNIEHSSTDLVEDVLNNNIRQFVLQVTQGCNLRCKYCAYSGNYSHREHSVKRMSFEMAKKGIDFLVEHSMNSDEIVVGFYGGEPLLEFDLIKKCVEYAKERAEGRKIRFNMTVNGTLLTEEIVTFLEKIECPITISLDGPKEIHDRNRQYPDGRGTFDTVMENVKMIQKKFPEYFDTKVRYNMVLDLHNDISGLANFFEEFPFIKQSAIGTSTISITYLKDKLPQNMESSVIFERRQMMLLYLEKLGRLKETRPNLFYAGFLSLRSLMHDERVARTRLPEKAHPGGPCLPGSKRIFMSVDGNIYPCERVSENSEMMKIGTIQNGFDVEKVKRLINIGQTTQENCKNCWAFQYCNQCAAFADDLNEFSAKKRLEQCSNVRKYVEEMFKDYCMLLEFGYDFDKEEIFESE